MEIIRTMKVKIIQSYQGNENESDPKKEDNNLSMDHKVPGSSESESYHGNESESDQDNEDKT